MIDRNREFRFTHDRQRAGRRRHAARVLPLGVRPNAPLLVAALALVFVCALAGPVRAQDWSVPPAGAMRADEGQPPESMWEEDAEESLHLVPGTAHQLLTDEEWHQRREQMRGLDGDQRQRFMADWRKEIVERAHERGVPIPGERPTAAAPEQTGAPPIAPEALGPDQPMEPPTRGAQGASRELEPAPDSNALPDPPRFPGD